MEWEQSLASYKHARRLFLAVLRKRDVTYKEVAKRKRKLDKATVRLLDLDPARCEQQGIETEWAERKFAAFGARIARAEQRQRQAKARQGRRTRFWRRFFRW